MNQQQAPDTSSRAREDGLNLQIKTHFDTWLKPRQRISLGDLPINADLYEHSADAPCILFLPGIGTYCEYYCEFLARLSAAGFNVLGVDVRGHGYSGGARGIYRIEEVIEDLQHAIDFLEERYRQRIGVIGCSIGARLGLALAEADCRVSSLLCHTLFLAELPPDIWHLFGWQSLAVSAFWLPDLQIDIRHFIDTRSLIDECPMGRYALTDQRMVWSYSMATLHSVFSFGSSVMREQLGIPTAVLIGEKDPVIRPGYVQDLIARAVQKFDYIEVAGAGHMLPLANAERMVEKTAKWFGPTL